MVVTYTVQDGRSNYLEGAMVRHNPVPAEPWQQLTLTQLLGLYLIIAVAFWASPSSALDKAASLFSSKF